MDEAERCHRLAFIFRGTLLDVGTPEEVVARRGLRCAEVVADDAPRMASALRAMPEVDEVAHYGKVLRLAALRGADPQELAARAAREVGARIEESRPARATVEDAFVSMVRHEAREAA
jgi:ABC-2 type transport system ATP-binding protein